MVTIDDTLPRPPRSRRPMRHQSRLEAWATSWPWSQIALYRVTLVAAYLLHIGFAAMAFYAGLPIFRLTAPDGYTRVWAIMLAIAALTSALGALADQLRVIERWSSLAVLALTLGYVVPLYEVGFLMNDANRQAVAVAATFMLLIPLSRFMWLASRAGRRPAGTS